MEITLEACYMRFEQKYLRLFVRCLLVAVASAMPVLWLFTGTALAAPGVTIPDDNLRAALEKNWVKVKGLPLPTPRLLD